MIFDEIQKPSQPFRSLPIKTFNLIANFSATCDDGLVLGQFVQRIVHLVVLLEIGDVILELSRVDLGTPASLGIVDFLVVQPLPSGA